MIRLFSFAVVLAVTLMTLPITCVYGADKIQYKTDPIKKNDEQKWRIAYYQGGNYVDYQIILKALIKGLMEIGWVESQEIPDVESIDDTKELWTWMTEDLKSQYIQFLADAYYTSDWNPYLRAQRKQDFIQRLNNDKDIDVVLAFGTWAGQDLANNEHSTPIEVISASDPLGAKIVKSIKDSGYDHVHAKIEPTRYEIQVRLFHDIIGFNTLGVVYDDTPEGKTYAAVDKIETVAKERGFKIVPCYAQWANATSDDDAVNQVLSCHKKLAEAVDAVYITTHRGVNLKSLPTILAPLNGNWIPTFSQSGSKEVQHGVLLSIAQADYKYAGEFHAKAIARVFNGANPRDLDQVFESPPKIAINLATAVSIGFEPPIDILGAADDIYKEIAKAR